MTLAEITKDTRLLLKIGGALVVLLIIIFVVFKGWNVLKSTFFPAPPPPPQESFGKLPGITFPASNASFPTFKVNTVSGVLPTFPSIFKVYALKKYGITITALQVGKTRAASLGFTENQQALSPILYRWAQPNTTNTLTYNINNFNFSVTSDYLANPPPSNPTSTDIYLKAVTGFIDTLNTDRSDIDMSKISYTYYSVADGALQSTSDPNSATVVKIYLPQIPVDNVPIYYPTLDPSILYFIVSAQDTPVVNEASYIHFAPELPSGSTYPLKTAATALSDLQSGKAFIVNPTPGSEVDITDVTLGYYLSNDPNETYLMPIMIFTGTNNFKAYVSAVAE